MITLLSRIFIKNRKQTTESSLCYSYAMLCGAAGIFFNLLLFAVKIITGLAARSVAVSADAFNNLGDAGSSLIAMWGFWVAGYGAGEKHPFGHGRIEWLVSLFTSLSVIFIGLGFAKSSIAAIGNPVNTKQNLLTAAVLSLSILIKLYMYCYNLAVGRKMDSSLLKAGSHLDLLFDLLFPSALQKTSEALKEKIVERYPDYRVLCNIIILHNHPMAVRAK